MAGSLSVDTKGYLEAKSEESSPKSSTNSAFRCSFCGEEVPKGTSFCSDDCASTIEAFNMAVAPTPSAVARDPSASSKSLLFRGRRGSSDSMGNLSEQFEAAATVSSASCGPSDVTSSSGSMSSFNALKSLSRMYDSQLPRTNNRRHTDHGAGFNLPMGTRAGSMPAGCATLTSDSSLMGTASLLAPPSPGDLPAYEPSLCIPWVSPEVSRELVIATFEVFGAIRQVDLVPREDHFLCFVHFNSWKTEDPAVNILRVRAVNCGRLARDFF